MRHLRAILREEKIYFADHKGSITAQNNRMLIDGCIVYAFVLICYTIISIATDQPDILKKMYYVYDCIHLIVCIAVFARPARWQESFCATQVFCIILELTLLSFFALEGAFVYKTQHSLYIPIAIILAQLLFIHTLRYSLSVIFAYTAAFAILSCSYKTPVAYINDFYIAMATFFSATIGYLLIARLRYREGRAIAKLEELSRIDILTGLNNKATIEQLCQDMICTNSSPCILIIIDLDNFKKINDCYGHNVGDEVLEGMGMAIKSVFCASDIQGRFGGDEFVILMNDCDNEDIVHERIEHLSTRVAELKFSVNELSVQYCAGATLRRENDDFHAMLERADRALYTAKTNGKGCLHIM